VLYVPFSALKLVGWYVAVVAQLAQPHRNCRCAASGICYWKIISAVHISNSSAHLRSSDSPFFRLLVTYKSLGIKLSVNGTECSTDEHNSGISAKLSENLSSRFISSCRYSGSKWAKRRPTCSVLWLAYWKNLCFLSSYPPRVLLRCKTASGAEENRRGAG